MSGLSFGDRYRAALLGEGAPPSELTAERLTVRGRAGYSFWQRYWASFIRVDLPVRLERAAAHDDPVFAASMPAAPIPLDGTLTDAELDVLLRRLQDVGVGVDPGSLSAEAPGALAVVSVVSDGAATFSVTLQLAPAPGRQLPMPLTIALVADRIYFVARVSPDGIVTFRHVPTGAWLFRRIRRPEPSLESVQGHALRSGESGTSAVALPAPRSGNLLAAASTARSAVFRIVLSEATLILHRSPADDFLLEVIDAVLDETPLILTTRYGTTSGAVGDLVIPVADQGALARLPGYAPGAPWELSMVAASEGFQGWGPERIAVSVRASANNATRRAWHAVSEFAPAEIRELIEAELR